MKFKTSFGQPVGITETPEGLEVVRTQRVVDPIISEQVDSYTIWHRDGLEHRDDGPAEVWYHNDGSIDGETWFRDGKVHRDDGPAIIEYQEGKVFPGDTRTFEELVKAGVVNSAERFQDGYRLWAIQYHTDGSIKFKEWTLGGERSQADSVRVKHDKGQVYPGDTRTPEELVRDGKVTRAEWIRDGLEHRDDGPAFIEYLPDGSLWLKTWNRDGKRHRDDGPAYIQYNEDGSIYKKAWFRDGRLHRDDGPAVIEYNEDGSILTKTWYRDGKVHRDDGPAYIRYRYGKVFPGDTRTIEELERDGAVQVAEWYRNGEAVRRFT